jgi:hypothetical protein
MGEWINKMYTHAMECYLVLKRNEVFMHSATWMNAEDITLSEISQVQNEKYCMIPFI